MLINSLVEMASTGEIASFGTDRWEAYWAGKHIYSVLCSVNGFKPPKVGSGVLIGGDIAQPEMKSVAVELQNLGYHLYCTNSAVESFLNSIPYVVSRAAHWSVTGWLTPLLSSQSAKKIFFPTKDKRKLREVFEEFDIQAVINLAKARGRDTLDEDYVARRNAVDFGIVVSRLRQRFISNVSD
jgi:carbamoyl-phosphate synthase large subunit